MQHSRARRLLASLAAATALAGTAVALSAPAGASGATAAGYDRPTPVISPGPVDLWARAGSTGVVSVPITTGSAAGTAAVVPATPVTVRQAVDDGEPVTVVVGSAAGIRPGIAAVPDDRRTASPTGMPGAAMVRVWATTAFPAATDGKAGIPVTVRAVDTDGSALPLTGEVRIASGGLSRDTAFVDPSGSATLLADTTSLPSGAATLTVTLLGRDGAAPTVATVPVTLSPTDIAAVQASVPYTTVYPVKDGYRDSLAIRVASSTSTGGAIAARGTASISLGGRTVARWRLTTSSALLHWSGMVGDRLTPGRYRLQLALKGPQGRTVTTTRMLSVSEKRLKVHIRTAGFSVIGEHGTQPFSDTSAQHGRLRCIESSTALVCRGTADLSGAASRIVLPPITLPAAALAAEQYGPLSIRFVTEVFEVSGTPRWIPAGVRSDPVRSGRYVYAWLTLPKGATEVPITLQLGPSGRVSLVGAYLQYRYQTLE